MKEIFEEIQRGDSGKDLMKGNMAEIFREILCNDSGKELMKENMAEFFEEMPEFQRIIHIDSEKEDLKTRLGAVEQQLQEFQEAAGGNLQEWIQGTSKDLKNVSEIAQKTSNDLNTLTNRTNDLGEIVERNSQNMERLENTIQATSEDVQQTSKGLNILTNVITQLVQNQQHDLLSPSRSHSIMYNPRLSNVGVCNTFWEPGIVMKGYFEKRGGGTRSSAWKRRFAVLNKSREILYYENEQCTDLKGELHIPPSAKIYSEGDYELQIHCDDRRWHFRYNSKEIRDEWINSIDKLMTQEDRGYCNMEGLLQKKGKNFGIWETRYVKLYGNKVMKNLPDERSSVLKSETSLSEMQKVSSVPGGRYSWKYGFVITSRGGRERHFRVQTEEERSMWTRCLGELLESPI